MKLLQNNPVGLGLLGLLGLLAAFAVAIGVAWSLPVKPIETDSNEVAASNRVGGAQPMELLSLEDYAVVTERPAFNQSRRPEASVEGEEVVEEAAPAKTIMPPELRLTGIVITPGYRVATLTHTGNGESLLVHEGERLGEDHGNWILTDVEPREILLVRPNGMEHQLELLVHDRAIDLPPPVESRAVVTGVAPREPDGAPDQPSGDGREEMDRELELEGDSRADEIRRRIQERREELQRQQEEEERAAAEAAPSGNEYRDAIRNMLQGNQNNSSTDDDGK